MQRGQISLDLILTMIIVLILIGAFSLIVTDFKTTQEKQLEKQQFNQIGQNVALLLSTTQVISDTNFRIETTIYPINYTNSNGTAHSTYPKITLLDQNTLNEQIIINGETIDSNFKVSTKASTKLDMNYPSTDGKIVIRNA